MNRDQTQRDLECQCPEHRQSGQIALSRHLLEYRSSIHLQSILEHSMITGDRDVNHQSPREEEKQEMATDTLRAPTLDQDLQADLEDGWRDDDDLERAEQSLYARDRQFLFRYQCECD